MLVAYKIIQSIIFLVFAFFISDVRKKEGMKLLVSEKRNILTKLIFLASAGAYFYVLTTSDRLFIYDYIAIVLTLSGMLLTVKAKMDLAGSHTWAGYQMQNSELVTKGIYQYLRHPLYTGIYIFMFGGCAIILPRIPCFLYFLVIAGIVYFMIYLARVARLETRQLSETFGEQFLTYKKQVHSFLPIRKYQP